MIQRWDVDDEDPAKWPEGEFVRYIDHLVLAAAKMMPEAAVVVAPGWRVSAEMFS
jgi:hypothetical protein